MGRPGVSHARPTSTNDRPLRRRGATDMRLIKPPNLAPCASWKTCGRRYDLVEYDAAATSWREIHRAPAFQVSARGIAWAPA